ncbi:hypothetical protein [Paenibacillus mendelii]|nr:hypothetical protein [Paenibacillus mendelii]MCQ6560237.1 hypothetical protein [Paenibacillus mendelii]
MNKIMHYFPMAGAKRNEMDGYALSPFRYDQFGDDCGKEERS